MSQGFSKLAQIERKEIVLILGKIIIRIDAVKK